MMKKVIILGLVAVMMAAFMVGCASKPSKPKKEVELSVIHEQIKAELGEDYLANMPLARKRNATS